MTILLIITHLIFAGLGMLWGLFLKSKTQQEETQVPNKFIQVVEKIGEDVVHAVELPFTYGGKIIALIKSGQADAPALVAAFDGLAAAGGKIGADAAIEIAADGTNLPEYLVAAKDSVAFASYFKNTFLPTIEKMFNDVKIDVQAPAVVTDPPAIADPAPAVVASTGAPA